MFRFVIESRIIAGLLGREFVKELGVAPPYLHRLNPVETALNHIIWV
ncbi:MAG: hypothetical protein V6Z81_02170 [Parvularculales bacterium]